MVGISVCQNCISGLPFSVCFGCSISKEVENVLADDFCVKQVSSMALIAFSSEGYKDPK